MAARLDSVSKYICERGSWNLTNLKLQKLLYMAQMLYLGRTNSRLTDTNFEAWDYGPVSPNLYHKVKMFGNTPIEDVFFDARNFKQDDPRRGVLDEVCDKLLEKRSAELVDITHWPEGAWARNYVPGARYIQIPDEDIAAEYRRRLERGSRSSGFRVGRARSSDS